MTYIVRVQKNGKIALPHAVIQKLRLEKGDELAFVEYKSRGEPYFFLTTPKSDLVRLLKEQEELIAR